MTEPRSNHADHDPFTIARLAVGDLDTADLGTATVLVAACAECRQLRDDLLLLAAANRDLPTPARPRDFRLGADDAARLHRRSWWDRIAESLAGPRFELARPVGAAMASLGLAGLLLSSFSSIQLGSATGAAPAGVTAAPAGGAGLEMYSTDTDDQGGVTEVDPDAPVGGAASPAGAQRETASEGEGGQGATADALSAPPEDTARRATDATLIVLSGTFLIVGLGLFGLRWTARRLGDG